MKTNQLSGSRIFRMSTLVTLGLIFLLTCSRQAMGQWATSSNNSNNINNTNSGNVGIGTNAPDVKLQVHHSSSNTNTANMQLPDLSFAFRNTSNTNGNMSLISFQDAAGWGTAQIGAIQVNQANHVGDLVFFTKGTGSHGERMRIRNDGFIGIGTTAPGFRLDVQSGQINASGGLCIAGDCKTSWSQVGGGGSSPWTISGSNIHFNTGNVGVGTTSPAFRIDVQGGQLNASGGLCIAGDCKTSWSQVGGGGSSQWTSSGSNIYFTSGNVGIGTSTPAHALDVNGSLRISSGNYFHLARAGVNRNISFTNGSNNDNLGMMTAYPSAGTDVASMFVVVPRGAGAYGVKSQLSLYNTDYIVDSGNSERLQIGAYGTKFAIFSGPFGNGANRPIDIYANGTSGQLFLNTNGNVGVGTTNPTAKLHVAGDVTVDGVIHARYQDVAEWVPADDLLPAGTVVVLSITQSNQVTASAQPYDTRVAGVISEKPGVALGEGGPGKVLVATTGRVRVKVDASSAPIAIGDLLVTSQIPGVAMKSQPLNVGGAALHRPGTLIGKALEPLANGRGEILVLLSLQ